MRYVKRYTVRGIERFYLNPGRRHRKLGYMPQPLDPSRPYEHALELLSKPAPLPPQLVQDGVRKHLAEIFRKAKIRAAKKGIAFEITITDVVSALVEADYHCSLSGIALSMEPKSTGYRSPFRPSIDRIDAKGGYIPGNIRIVCVAVNAALSDWGDDVFWKVVEAAIRKRNKARLQLSTQFCLHAEAMPDRLSAESEN